MGDHGNKTSKTQSKDHGGDMDRARAIYGDGAWMDLSTGINPKPYPVADLPALAWGALPTRSDIAALETAAKAAYGASCDCVALSGAQAAIQLVPRLMQPGQARVVGPTYNEHAGALQAQGWDVQQVETLADLAGAQLAVVVNPNNPDGRMWSPQELLELTQRVDLLIVDESFMDATQGDSILPHLGDEPVITLRSFGKFYGLAGARLGFALGHADRLAPLRAMAGPWAVNGPAIALGRRGLQDVAWQEASKAQLASDCARMDALAAQNGWDLVGGTALFRTYATPNAAAVQNQLAKAHIWTRIFPYSDTWVRFGLPGSEPDWTRLEAALR